MNKKQLVKKLNSQKGITGADIVIALLIILTTVGVISMVYANLVVDSKQIDRKTAATRIATNILENLDMIYYDEVEENLKLLTDSGIATKVDNTYTIPGQDNVKVFETKVPNGYKVILEMQNENLQYDVVKKINVKVEYTVDGQNKNIELNKVRERETIRECNSPNFTEEYIRQVVQSGTDYEMFSDTSEAVQTGVKIICPVQYDYDTNNYKVIDVSSNQMWYSYSNKEWARILVLESDELTACIDSTTKIVTNEDVLKGENSYVWIPRFGVKNGGDLFGDTCFKYKGTDFAILNSYNDGKEFIYNYLDINNLIEWSTRGISFESDNLVGKWSKYSDITTISTDAYNLNQSQYGPMIED